MRSISPALVFQSYASLICVVRLIDNGAKLDKRPLSVVILLILAFTMVSCFPDAKSTDYKLSAALDTQIENAALKLYVYDETGNINLETVQKPLLFPSDTSNIAFKVDNTEQNSGSSSRSQLCGGLNAYMVQKPETTAPDTVQVEWKMLSVSLKVVYRLANKNLQVKATMTNEDNVSHKAGVRFLLDTQLDTNDGAPLYAPDVGVATFERDMPNPTFSYWMAYDRYPNPTLQAYCSLTVVPDRVAFTHWPHSAASLWDYTTDSNQRFYTAGYTRSPESDSAVLMYYDPTQPLLALLKQCLFHMA